MAGTSSSRLTEEQRKFYARTLANALVGKWELGWSDFPALQRAAKATAPGDAALAAELVAAWAELDPAALANLDAALQRERARLYDPPRATNVRR